MVVGYADLSDGSFGDLRDLSTPGRHKPEVGILVRRDPSANAGGMSRGVELDSYPGGRTRPTAGRGPEHTEQRPDREGGTELQPRVQLLLIPTSE